MAFLPNQLTYHHEKNMGREDERCDARSCKTQNPSNIILHKNFVLFFFSFLADDFYTQHNSSQKGNNGFGRMLLKDGTCLDVCPWKKSSSIALILGGKWIIGPTPRSILLERTEFAFAVVSAVAEFLEICYFMSYCLHNVRDMYFPFKLLHYFLRLYKLFLCCPNWFFFRSHARSMTPFCYQMVEYRHTYFFYNKVEIWTEPQALT